MSAEHFIVEDKGRAVAKTSMGKRRVSSRTTRKDFIWNKSEEAKKRFDEVYFTFGKGAEEKIFAEAASLPESPPTKPAVAVSII